MGTEKISVEINVLVIRKLDNYFKDEQTVGFTKNIKTII